MQTTTITLLILFFSFQTIGQKFEEVHVPASYETVQMKYFLISEIESDIEKIPAERIQAQLGQAFENNGVFNLTNIPIANWPDGAIETPKEIITSKVKIESIGFPNVCASIKIENTDYRKHRILLKSIKPKKRQRKKYNDCLELMNFLLGSWVKEIKENSNSFQYRIEKTESYVTYRNSGKPAKLKFKRSIPVTAYDLKNINDYFENSKSLHKLEGIYKFEDLEKLCTYDFAIIKSENNFNLIWMNMDFENWKVGNLKGRIIHDIKTEKNEVIWINNDGRRRRASAILHENESIQILFSSKNSQLYEKIR